MGADSGAKEKFWWLEFTSWTLVSQTVDIFLHCFCWCWYFTLSMLYLTVNEGSRLLEVVVNHYIYKYNIVWQVTVEAELVTFDQMTCSFPDPFPVGTYEIRMKINDVWFGNSSNFKVIDSRCMKCDVEGMVSTNVSKAINAL